MTAHRGQVASVLAAVLTALLTDLLATAPRNQRSPRSRTQPNGDGRAGARRSPAVIQTGGASRGNRCYASITRGTIMGRRR
jgi:hypothetical protein